LLVPEDHALRTMLIRECHDSATGGHLGRDKTIEQMKRRFTWSKMDQDIELYVKTCEQCQRNKPSQQRTPGLLMPIAPPDYPGHTWTMDYIIESAAVRSLRQRRYRGVRLQADQAQTFRRM